jgi:putative transposase
VIELPRSSAYYHSQAEEQRQQTQLDLQDRIEDLALTYPRYGYRRITAALHREGTGVNHKKVLRLMKASDLLVRPLRGFQITTDSRHAFPVYPNLYQNRIPSELNRIWTADITYIRLPLCFVYLAVVMDACSRKVLGWALGTSLEAELALSALRQALALRDAPEGLVHHSDRGVQYASGEYTALLKAHGIQISMSRKGNPYDNAQMESFMKTLKYEEVFLNEYRTFEEARRQISHFISLVYNRKRLHSSLGYLPPDEYELQYNQTALKTA